MLSLQGSTSLSVSIIKGLEKANKAIVVLENKNHPDVDNNITLNEIQFGKLKSNSGDIVIEPTTIDGVGKVLNVGSANIAAINNLCGLVAPFISADSINVDNELQAPIIDLLKILYRPHGWNPAYLPGLSMSVDDLIIEHTNSKLYVDEQEITLTTNQTFNLYYTTGYTYIYHDLSRLNYYQYTKVLTATAYSPNSISETYGGTLLNNVLKLICRSTHFSIMDKYTKNYLVNTSVMKFISGLNLENWGTTAGTSSYTISSGVVLNLDITVNIAAKTSYFRIMYQSGSNANVIITAPVTHRVLNNSSGALINNLVSGAWTLTQITTNVYFNYYIFVTPFKLYNRTLNLSDPSNSEDEYVFLIVPGQISGTLANVRLENHNTIITPNMPLKHMMPLYRITYYRLNNLVNGHCRIQEVVKITSPYYATIQSTYAGSTTVNHNDLESIQGGILGEYYHLSSSQVNSIQHLTSDASNTFMNSNLDVTGSIINTTFQSIESKVQNQSAISGTTTFTGSLIGDNLKSDNETRLLGVESKVQHITSDLTTTTISSTLNGPTIEGINSKIRHISANDTDTYIASNILNIDPLSLSGAQILSSGVNTGAGFYNTITVGNDNMYYFSNSTHIIMSSDITNTGTYSSFNNNNNATMITAISNFCDCARHATETYTVFIRSDNGNIYAFSGSWINTRTNVVDIGTISMCSNATQYVYLNRSGKIQTQNAFYSGIAQNYTSSLPALTSPEEYKLIRYIQSLDLYVVVSNQGRIFTSSSLAAAFNQDNQIPDVTDFNHMCYHNNTFLFITTSGKLYITQLLSSVPSYQSLNTNYYLLFGSIIDSTIYSLGSGSMLGYVESQESDSVLIKSQQNDLIGISSTNDVEIFNDLTVGGTIYNSTTITHVTEWLDLKNTCPIGYYCNMTSELTRAGICKITPSKSVSKLIVGVVCKYSKSNSITNITCFATHGDVEIEVLEGDYELGDIIIPTSDGKGRKIDPENDSEYDFCVRYKIPIAKVMSQLSRTRIMGILI